MVTNLEFRTARKTLVAILFAGLALGMAASVHAQECSLAGVAGEYAFSDSGTIVRIGTTTVNFPRAAVGQLTLDAAGNINGKLTASLNGSVSRTTLSGTYTVNADCTGTTSFSESDLSGNLILKATVDIVWDDNAQEIRFIFTSVTLADGTPLATVVNGNARKLFTQSNNQQ